MKVIQKGREKRDGMTADDAIHPDRKSNFTSAHESEESMDSLGHMSERVNVADKVEKESKTVEMTIGERVAKIMANKEAEKATEKATEKAGEEVSEGFGSRAGMDKLLAHLQDQGLVGTGSLSGMTEADRAVERAADRMRERESRGGSRGAPSSTDTLRMKDRVKDRQGATNDVATEAGAPGSTLSRPSPRPRPAGQGDSVQVVQAVTRAVREAENMAIQQTRLRIMHQAGRQTEGQPERLPEIDRSSDVLDRYFATMEGLAAKKSNEVRPVPTPAVGAVKPTPTPTPPPTPTPLATSVFTNAFTSSSLRSSVTESMTKAVPSKQKLTPAAVVTKPATGEGVVKAEKASKKKGKKAVIAPETPAPVPTPVPTHVPTPAPTPVPAAVKLEVEVKGKVDSILASKAMEAPSNIQPTTTPTPTQVETLDLDSGLLPPLKTGFTLPDDLLALASSIGFQRALELFRSSCGMPIDGSGALAGSPGANARTGLRTDKEGADPVPVILNKQSRGQAEGAMRAGIMREIVADPVWGTAHLVRERERERGEDCP
jgi:hypothetical protein